MGSRWAGVGCKVVGRGEGTSISMVGMNVVGWFGFVAWGFTTGLAVVSMAETTKMETENQK